jgi:hypothetical protein
MREMRNAYKILVGKSEGKRPFVRPGSRWKDNIKMNFREKGWKGENWMHMALDRDQ